MRTPSALRLAALGAVAIGVAAPLVRRRLGLPRPVVSVLGWQAPVALAFAVPRSRARDAALYTLQMWAYLAHYEMPADDREEVLRRVRIGYPIRADRALTGGGDIPTVRLQRALGRPGRVFVHDAALSAVHWAWFLVPHGTVVYVLVRRPEQFARAASLMAATFDLGLLGYWLVPTAPPWWAARAGRLPPVRRIMAEAGERIWRRLWMPLYDALSGNQFAAMPSLHFATSVTAAHVLSETGRAAGALGWAYASALGFALVYLGEHYVVDLLAGLALAEGVRMLAPAATPLALAAGRELGRIEAALR